MGGIQNYYHLIQRQIIGIYKLLLTQCHGTENQHVYRKLLYNNCSNSRKLNVMVTGTLGILC